MSIYTGEGSEQIIGSWSAADPVTPGAEVTYNGYISQTSLSQDFDSPSFSTTELSHDLSTLLQVGKTYYVVVRAESEGAEEGNFVELNITLELGEPSTDVPQVLWDYE